MERVAVDIMGPVPQTDNGNLYILVLGDYFSKWTEAFPLKDHTAQTVADVLVEQFVSRFGVMRSLHSDQGREFESDLISEMCKLLQVRKTRTVPYNPKSDGMIERANRTVIQMLTTLVNEARNDWDEHLPYVMMAYRASVHESTGLTPNKLMLNHETNLPIDLMVGAPPDTPVCPVQYVEWVREASEHAFEFVQRTLRASAERQKRLYDRKGGLPSFEVGDSVWRYNHPGSKLKFGKKWEGPYLVTARVNTLCYRIQKSQSSRSIVVHVDHLKMYEGPKPVASWLVPEAQDDPHEAKQRVLGSNDIHDDNVDEAVNDPDLLQQQHNLSASNDKLPISIRVPTNHPAEQRTGNSNLHVTVSEESAEQQPSNSDLDETIPYETAEQHTKNTDLDTTIPYETAEQHPKFTFRCNYSGWECWTRTCKFRFRCNYTIWICYRAAFIRCRSGSEIINCFAISHGSIRCTYIIKVIRYGEFSIASSGNQWCRKTKWPRVNNPYIIPGNIYYYYCY